MTCVSPEGRITPGCPGLYAPEHEAAWRRIVTFAHAETGARLCCQIGHSGRKGSTQLGWEEGDAPLEHGNWPLMSASALPWGPRSQVPKAMDRADMDAVTAQFIAATLMAARAGFDMIELHAAHGYLFHQFYSPLSNQRSDNYGGSFENRIRFLLETIKAVRSVIPDSMPLFVRISASDWVEQGWSIEESIELSKQMKQLGVDLVDVSSGGNLHNAPIKAVPGFQVPFAQAIRQGADIPTSAVGLITEAKQADEIISSGKADAVFLARAMIRNPRWAMAAAEELGVKIDWPLQFDRGRTLT
jgi:anthraniloyl-CoA monooxygenase